MDARADSNKKPVATGSNLQSKRPVRQIHMPDLPKFQVPGTDGGSSLKRQKPGLFLSDLPQFEVGSLKRKAAEEFTLENLGLSSNSLDGTTIAASSQERTLQPAFDLPGHEMFESGSLDLGLIDSFYGQGSSRAQSNTIETDIFGDVDFTGGSNETDEAMSMNEMVFQNPVARIDRDEPGVLKFHPTVVDDGSLFATTMYNGQVMPAINTMAYMTKHDHPPPTTPDNDDSEAPARATHHLPNITEQAEVFSLQGDIFSVVERDGVTLPSINSTNMLMAPSEPRAESPPAAAEMSNVTTRRRGRRPFAPNRSPPPVHVWDRTEPSSMMELLNEHFVDVCIDHTLDKLHLHRWPWEGALNGCTADPVEVERVVLLTNFYRYPDGSMSNLSWGDVTHPLMICMSCGKELEKGKRCLLRKKLLA